MFRFPFRRKRSAARSFSAPAGERLYAIGDVHGCLDKLNLLLDRIDADDRARGQATTTIVLLGDLIDRGPDSEGVVERVDAMMRADPRVRLIAGNHEEIFVAACRGDAASAKALLAIGGYATLESYGIGRDAADAGSFVDLAALLLDRIPRAHVDRLGDGRAFLRAGDYLFVHAGIRPGRPLAEQRPHDLRWIREPFLSAVRDDGLMVVHGHTPSDGIDERPDRIGIDTGAFRGGPLSAIGIEGAERWYLSAD